MNVIKDKWYYPLQIQYNKYRRLINNSRKIFGRRDSERFALLKLQEFLILSNQKPLVRSDLGIIDEGTIFRIKINPATKLNNNGFFWYVSGKIRNNRTPDIFRVLSRKANKKRYFFGEKLVFGDSFELEQKEFNGKNYPYFFKDPYKFLLPKQFTELPLGEFEVMSNGISSGNGKNVPQIKVSRTLTTLEILPRLIS